MSDGTGSEKESISHQKGFMEFNDVRLQYEQSPKK